MHGGLVSRAELCERWFGSDIIDWLKGVINGVSGAPLVSNTYSDDFTLILLDETFGPCPMGPQGTLVSGSLNVQAQAHVEIDTNFGFTLITTLSFPPDLSNSYLYFRNKGQVTAKFTANATATATFDSGDIKLLSADQFGAAFAVPGILTIGPNFQLFGNVQGQVTLGAYFESNVNLAQWDIRQTCPDANHDWDPEATTNPGRDGTQELLSPEFEYGISASGFVTAHIKPTITFGIDFNQNFLPVDSCTVNLVADGYITFHASASAGSSVSSFCYGIDAGADLYANVQAPSLFGWSLAQPNYQIAQSPPIQIVPETCPISSRDLQHETARYFPVTLDDADIPYPVPRQNHSRQYLQPTRHEKRGAVYGPIIRVKQLSCPTDTGNGGEGPEACPICSDPSLPPGSISKRDNEVCVLETGDPTESSCPSSISKRDDFISLFSENATNVNDIKIRSHLVKRTQKILPWTAGGVAVQADFGPYPSCGDAANSGSVIKWFGDELGSTTPICPTQITKFNVQQIDPSTYQTDHIFEAQTVLYFLDFLRGGQSYGGLPNMPTGYQAATNNWVSGVLVGYPLPNALPFGVEQSANLFQAISRDLGGNGEGLSRLALLYGDINGQKGQFFQLNFPSLLNSAGLRATKISQRNIAGVFQYLQQGAIWPKYQQTSQLIEESLHAFDTTYTRNAAGNQITRPNRANGQPQAGLRDLWCYFIDRYLRTIETTGGQWAMAARNTFANDPMGQGTEGQNWVNTVMSGNGVITPGQMVFPHSGPQTPGPGVVVQSSYYGAWTLGAAGPF
ncbi:hypothetical protein MMC17_006317 [Xylographa soralifera]|nr:hypothetical protein [Xylographa soralifera]